MGPFSVGGHGPFPTHLCPMAPLVYVHREVGRPLPPPQRGAEPSGDPRMVGGEPGEWHSGTEHHQCAEGAQGPELPVRVSGDTRVQKEVQSPRGLAFEHDTEGAHRETQQPGRGPLEERVAPRPGPRAPINSSEVFQGRRGSQRSGGGRTSGRSKKRSTRPSGWSSAAVGATSRQTTSPTMWTWSLTTRGSMCRPLHEACAT